MEYVYHMRDPKEGAICSIKTVTAVSVLAYMLANAAARDLHRTITHFNHWPRGS
jgi:hypothetical protein